MDQAEVLDLESLSPDAAREVVRKSYRSIRSNRIRSIYRELVRPCLLVLGGRKRQSVFMGINQLDREYLERLMMFGDRIKVRGTFLLIIGKDVSPALAAETIESISVAGIISSTEEVWRVLKDRCRIGLWAGTEKEG